MALIRMSATEAMRAAGFLPAMDAAKRCGLDQSTIHRWAAAGTVVSRHVGKRLFISAASLAAAVGPEIAAAAGLGDIAAPKAAP